MSVLALVGGVPPVFVGHLDPHLLASVLYLEIRM